MIGPTPADALRTVIAALSGAAAPAALAAAVDTTEQTFTVPGLTVNDLIISVQPPGAQAAHVALAGARVSAPNTLALLWANLTAAANQPVAGNYILGILRYQ